MFVYKGHLMNGNKFLNIFNDLKREKNFKNQHVKNSYINGSIFFCDVIRICYYYLLKLQYSSSTCRGPESFLSDTPVSER